KKKPRSKITRRKVAMSTLAIVLALSGVYLLVLVFSPQIVDSGTEMSPAATEELIARYQTESINAIIIPSIQVDVPILEGDEDVLNIGAWHRKPEQGNPTKNGNFIVTAHRFTLGFSP